MLLQNGINRFVIISWEDFLRLSAFLERKVEDCHVRDFI